MKKALIAFLAIAVIAVFACTELYALGTSSGTILSNQTCKVTFSNISGTIYSNTSAVVTTVVTQGFDMSVLSNLSALTQNGSAGGKVTFSFSSITNLGNIMETFTIGSETNTYSSANWLPLYMFAKTNGAIVSSNSNAVSGTIDRAAGGSFNWEIEIEIPAIVTNGEWIEINMGIWNTASGGVSGAGDGWPGANATVLGYSPDTANTRDMQDYTVRIQITGPVILISKSVSTNRIRPFEVMEYEIEYTNIGGAAAYNIVIEDYIPTYTVITQDSAENNNTLHNGGATVSYYEGSAYSNSTYDNGGIANRTNIQRVRWTLSSNVGVGDGGIVRFSVMVK